MRACVSALLLAALGAGLSSCSNSSAQSPPPESIFVVLNQGVSTPQAASAKKQTKVLTSQADYAAELANYTSDPAATVDFTQGKVLLVDMGFRRTGGYDIGVNSVDVGADFVVANIVLTQPGPTCEVIAVITSPYQFVFIPSLKEVLVSESLTTHVC